MKIVIDIPKEFEKDYNVYRFKDFFGLVLADIEFNCMCGNYEKETAEMFIKAFEESKELQEQNKWHYCKNGDLPREKGYKLVYLSSKRISIACYNYPILPHSDKPIGWGFSLNYPIDFSEEYVIAWMKLPKFEEKKTCFDCKNHMMSDCYLECRIKNRINNDEICEKFEEAE